MKRKILTTMLASIMAVTVFGTAYVANAAETVITNQTENQEEEFKITETKINGSADKTVYTDDALNFTSSTTGAKGNVTYRYFISNGGISAERTEIPEQGYKITEPGRYRINVRADDENGNVAFTDFFIDVEFKITGTKINGSFNTTVHTNEPLYFTSTNTSAASDVTYRYFISNGGISAERTEIPQGYKITEPGRYRINVRADDAKGNTAFTDFFIDVVD
ncbi:MAG: hypothetical protein ACI398_01080 [Clostridium sp.]